MATSFTAQLDHRMGHSETVKAATAKVEAALVKPTKGRSKATVAVAAIHPMHDLKAAVIEFRDKAIGLLPGGPHGRVATMFEEALLNLMQRLASEL